MDKHSVSIRIICLLLFTALLLCSCHLSPSPTSTAPPQSTAATTTETAPPTTTAPPASAVPSTAPKPAWAEVLAIAAKEYAQHTDIQEYSIKYTFLRVLDPIGFATGYNPGLMGYIDSVEALSQFKERYTADATGIYDATAQSDLCPTSFLAMCDDYDAQFFSQNLLLIVNIVASSNELPVIAKVSAGPQGEYVPPMVVDCKFDTGATDDKTLFLVFIELPSQYKDLSRHEIGLAINGEYYP